MGGNKNGKSKRSVEETHSTPENEPPKTPHSIPVRVSSYTTPRPDPNRPYASSMTSPNFLQDEIVSPSARKWLSSEDLEEMEGPEGSLALYRKQKRNFSEITSSAGPSTKHVSINVEDRLRYHVLRMEAKIKAIDAGYEARKDVLRKIRNNWEQGLAEAKDFEFQEESKRLEQEIGDLLVAKAAMRASFHELAGMETDLERWNKRSYADDWAYIDLLVSRLKEPEGVTVTLKKPRESQIQERRRGQILKAYGVNPDEPNKGWCPISGDWVPKSMLKAAHIVRYNTTEFAAVHLFGPIDTPGGHIWSAKNGLSVASCYEEMIDQGQIAIVPTNGGQGLMVTVLDRTSLEHKEDAGPFPMGKTLDGRMLKFCTLHRPAMKYLYFSFAINLLRRQRFAASGWWKDRLQNISNPFFAIPGEWVRQTTLKKLAMRIGHLPEEEAENFVITTAGGRLEDSFWKDEKDGDAEACEMATSLVEYSVQAQNIADASCSQ